MFQFYLAQTFKVVLEPNELITLIPAICQEKWTSWKLWGINLKNGTFEDVILTDYDQVMRGFIQLKQKIIAVTNNAPTVGNSSYDLLTKI